MAKDKTTEKETVTIKIKGVIKSAFTHVDKNDDGTTRATVNNVHLFPDAVLDGGLDEGGDVWKIFDVLYTHVSDKWIPKWYKDKSCIKLKTGYNLPVQIADEDAEDYKELIAEHDKGILTFGEFVQRGKIANANVIIKCNIKESAVYPSAMRVLSDGEVYDAFKDF